MPELRIDPICGRRVYVAEDRAGRPNDFASGSFANDELREGRNCPFCAGSEAQTPPAVATALDEAGRWIVRVVPNKFPAVSWAEAPPVDAHLAPQPAAGVHEVIIEAPDHLDDVTQIDPQRLAVVLRTYRDRLQFWAADSRLRHGIVFKNSGLAAGASLEHLHSQFVALPYVPLAVQAELDGCEQYFAQRRQCAFCALLQRELEACVRVVLRERGYVAIAAYAARQPFETWILPERHAARYDGAGDSELAELAHVLLKLLARLKAQVATVAYNLILHTGPFDGAGEKTFHWHWELVPRSANLAGFELGAGAHINSLAPERAAQLLRDVGERRRG